MPTTARGIWTPSDTDAVDFTTDLATMAGTIDNALDLYGNALRGTASQRAAFLSTAVDGMLWQDTDGVRMIWRKDGALWVPAVWRWRGTTAQMNSFGANAPDGFVWRSTTNNIEYLRRGGLWSGGTWNLTPASGFSGTITASMSLGLVEIVVGVTGVTGTSGHATLVSSVPAEIRPSFSRRGGLLYLGGSRYGAGVVLDSGLLAVSNLSTVAGDRVDGSIVYRAH